MEVVQLRCCLLDAEKAYDRAHISFLERVLRAIKFPEVLVKVVTTLYKNHWARVQNPKIYASCDLSSLVTNILHLISDSEAIRPRSLMTLFA